MNIQIADSLPKELRPKSQGKRVSLPFRAGKEQNLSSEQVVELLAFILACIQQGVKAEGLGFLCKANFSWTLKQFGLPEGILPSFLISL